MPNRLAKETSPYLLQHANNPVDWYPWGEEALAKAKAEDKPIFLSIGYSACHWCHVMEHESFENDVIAAVMNDNFVNIKVDREERPDLDSIYMDAVVAMTGHGGWPMSVWLTPQGVPFYGGTYFPPTDRMGMPGFQRVLEALAETYRRQKDQIDSQGQQLLSRMSPRLNMQGGGSLDPAVLSLAVQNITRNIDYVHGGSKGAPKFPQPMTYEFLLRAYLRTGQRSLLEVVELTLEKMAHGGIYDQLGGGFHRYSTDAVWLAPHFEKMLYDNALLARLYLHTYQITGKAEYRRIVEETLDYVLREMTDAQGGFYSTQDADSEGEEGKFFVWEPSEVEAVLGGEKAGRFAAAYDVTAAGNWEGKSILRLTRPLAEVADELGMAEDAFKAELAESRQKLFEQREQRIKPGRDEKVLTAWNGMMLAAFAEAARVLDRADYRAAASKNADFILRELRYEGRLFRSWKAGQAKLMGYLEDYAFVAEGLLALYQTTFDERWFVEAQSLGNTILNHFNDPQDGGFFDTADDHEQLVVRPKSIQDNATPAGNSLAVTVLLQLASYTGDSTYYDPAVKSLGAVQQALTQYASAFAQWLVSLEYALAPAKEVALIGRPAEPGMAAMLSTLQGPFRPNQVVALAETPTSESLIPLLNDRPLKDGHSTAYVCQNFACQLPVNTAEALAKQL